MRTTSIVSDKLKSFDYYVNKLPLFLQNSYGFIEHYRIWYDLYTGADEDTHGIIKISDIILNLLNIFDDDYLAFVRDMPGSGSTGSTDYGTYSDMLDKIGALFGASRSFNCIYRSGYDIIKEELHLNNKEFLILIKAQIIKNFCEGTYEQIKEYYESAGLAISTVNNPDDNAHVDLYLVNDPESTATYSANIEKMFLAGMFNVESMGIVYYNTLAILEGLLKWDSSDSDEYWDEGVWAL